MLIKHFLSLFLLKKITRFGWKIWVTRNNFRAKLLKKWYCLRDSSFLASQELPSFLIVLAQARDSLQNWVLIECWQLLPTVLLLLTPSLDCQTDQLPANHDIPGNILHICEAPLILSHQGSHPFTLMIDSYKAEGQPRVLVHLSRAKARGDECLQRWQKTFDPWWHSSTC